MVGARVERGGEGCVGLLARALHIARWRRMAMATATFTTALTGRMEVELTVRGRSSGRKITRPVWFVEDGDTLSSWFR
jgi:hypothetical protein